MSPKSEHVARELLAIGFRAYPRGLLNGYLFACLTVVFFWPGVPHAILLAWLALYSALVVARLAIARSFLRGTAPAGELDIWVRRAALGFAATGFAWGMLGAAAVHFDAAEPVYGLWIVFLIGLFAVQQMQNTGAHPWVFRAFLLGAMVPIAVVSILEDAPRYWLRLAFEALFFTMAWLAGRGGTRDVRDSIEMRFENLELVEELRRQKEDLDRANSAKTRFLAAASHDLRQPMQAIALLAESLDERVRDTATRRIVDSMRNSVAAMSSLLNTILDISRLDAGTTKAQTAVFPISRVLDRLRSSFAERAALKGLVLRVRPSAEFVETDEILLYRIVANLTENAVRYTSSGGILVACRRRGDSVSLGVWDSGIGIPEDKLGEIFLEFHQLGNPQRDREQGLGLGLAIVDRTARLLGLKVTVRSRIGKGSAFALDIPRGDPAKIRMPEPVPAAASLEGCAVLVVEDDRDIRNAMTLLLEGWNCRVATAASGADADAALAQLGSAPDIVIADYDLAGENGIQVIDRIRGTHSGIEGILVSGDVSREAITQADLSRYPMLHKPVRPARLRATLAALWRDRAEASA